MSEDCTDCHGKLTCVSIDDVRTRSQIGLWFVIVFFLVMGAVIIVERSVAVRPSDVLEQLQQTEQNISEQIDRLEKMIRDHAETGEDAHQRLK